MNCLELEKKKKEIRFDLLSRVFGSEAANEIVRNYDFGNSSIPFEKMPNGKESMLFKKLLQSYNIETAIAKSAEVRTIEFLNKYGNWLEDKESFIGETYETGEPTLESLQKLENFELKVKKNKEEGDEEKALAELREELKSSYTYEIEGFTNEELKDTINTFVGLAHKVIVNGKINKNLLFLGIESSLKAKSESIKKYREKNKDILKSYELEKLDKSIKLLDKLTDDKNAFNKIALLVDNELNKLGYKEIGKEKTSDYADKQAEDPVMKEIWNDDKKWSLPLKDTLQFSLKLFLAGIQKPVLKDGVPTGKYELNSIGYRKTISSEDVISKIITYFEDIEVTRNNLLERLKGSNIPEFVELYNKIESTTHNKDRIINSLVASLNRAKNEKYTVLKKEDGYIVYATNGRADRKYIINDWRSNQHYKATKGELFKIDKSTGFIVLDKDAMDKLRKQRFYIKELLKAEDFPIYLLASTKDSLSDILEKGIKSDKLSDKDIIKELEDYMNNKYMPSAVNKSGDINFIKAALDKVFDFSGTTVKAKVSDAKELRDRINELKLEVSNSSDDAVAKVNRINLAAPKIVDYLSSMGLDFKEETIKKFLNKPGVYMSEIGVEDIEAVKTEDLFGIGKKYKGENVFYTILEDAVEDASAKKLYGISTYNILNTRAVTKVFSKLKELEEVENLETTFINGEGNTEASHGYTNGIDIIIKNFREGNINSMLTDPFSRHSGLLLKIGKEGTEVTVPDKDFRMVYVDSLTTGNKDKAVIKQKASPREKMVMRFNLFNFNSAGFKKKYSIVEPLVISDKSRRVAFRINRVRISTDKDSPSIFAALNYDEIKEKKPNFKSYITAIRLNGEPLKRMLNIVRAEAERIKFVKGLTEEQKAQLPEAYTKGGDKFLLFPELNDLEFVKQYRDEKGGIDTASLILDENLEKYLSKVVRKEANLILEKAEKYGLMSRLGRLREVDLKDFSGEAVAKIAMEDGNIQVDRSPMEYYEKDYAKALHFATELALNEIVTAFDAMTLLRDPAYTYVERKNSLLAAKETISKYIKRLGSDFGVRIKGNHEFNVKFGEATKLVNHAKVKYLIFDDLEIEESAKNYKGLVDKALGKTNVTDGTELTTLRDHIINLYSYGKIDDKIFNSIHSKIIENYKNGRKIILSNEERIALIPQKPLYSGITEKLGLRVPLIVKSSSIPLIEELTAGTPLDTVRKKMEEIEAKEIFNEDGSLKDFNALSSVRLAFKSAVKVGSPKVKKLFNKDHTISAEAFNNPAILEVNRKGFGIQQEESIDDTNKVNTFSQADKLITLGTLTMEGFKYKGQTYNGEQLRDIKGNIKKEWIRKKYDRLVKRLKLDDSNYYFKSPDKLVKEVQKIAKENNISLRDLGMLESNNGEFKLPLYTNKAYRKIISNLIAEVTKGVFRPKISGRGSVQITNAGMLFQGDLKNSGIIFRNNLDKHLKYTRMENGALKSAQILISREYFESRGIDLDRFTKVIDGRKMLKEEAFDSELFKSFAVRIPTQNHSSMIQLEIAGFLPKGYKEMVVVPDEITRQMGSDFDIDHLYKYLYNYKLVGKKKTAVTEDVKKLFQKLLEKEKLKRVYIKNEGVIRLKDAPDFSETALKVKVAKDMGYYYDVKKESLFDLYKNVRFEKVSSKNVKETNIASLENDYIDVMHAYIEHPEVAKKAIKPLDSEDGREIADYIRNLKYDEKEKAFFTPLGGDFTEKEYVSNQAGKDGISIQSSVSMLFPHLEGYRLPVKYFKEEPRISFKIGDKVIDLTHLGIGSYKYKGEKRTNAINNEIVQNESVDNANNKNLDDLGYSTNRAPLFNGLNLLTSVRGESLPLKTLALFLNNPTLKEVIDKIEVSRDMFSYGYVDTSKKLKEFADRIETKETVVLSDDLLEKAIEGKLNDEISKAVSKEVLNIASTAFSLGSNFMRIFSSINLETKGSGSSIAEMLRKEVLIKKYIFENSRVPGISLLLTGTPDRVNLYANSRNTVLGEIYHLGITQAKNILGAKLKGAPLTHLGDYSFRAALSYFLSKGNPSEKNVNSIEKGFLAYKYNSAELSLFKDSNDNPIPLYAVRNKLLKGDNNLYIRTQEYLKKPSNLEGRDFLSVIGIQPVRSTEEPIIFRTNLIDTSEQAIEKAVKSFTELLTSSNKETRELGLDFLRVMMLNGNTYSPKSINMFFPYEYVNATSIGRELKDAALKPVSQEVITQIIQHHPQLADYDRELNKIGYLVSEDKSENTFFITKSLEEQEFDSNKLPTIVRKGKLRNPRLYKFVGYHNGGAIYERISLLGNGRTTLVEYDPFSNNTRSIIKENNPDKIASQVAKDLGLNEIANKLSSGEIIEPVLANNSVTLGAEDIIANHFGIRAKTPLNEIANRFSKSDKKLFDFISKMKGNNDIKVTFDKELAERGAATRNLEIKLNPENFTNSYRDREKFLEEAKEVIAHETLHAATLSEAIKYKKGILEEGRVNTSFRKLDKYLGRIRDEVLSNTEYKDEYVEFRNKLKARRKGEEVEFTAVEKDRFYGLSDVFEFIAETANKGFLNFLGNFEVYGEDIRLSLPSRLEAIYNSIIAEKGLENNEVAKKVIKLSLALLESVATDRISNESTETSKTPKDKYEVQVGRMKYLYDESTNEVSRKSGASVSDVMANKVMIKHLFEKGGLKSFKLSDGSKVVSLNKKGKDVFVFIDKDKAGKEVKDAKLLKEIENKTINKLQKKREQRFVLPEIENKAVASMEKVKADYANKNATKLISFGPKGSISKKYAEDNAEIANTGNYSSEDIVLVSVSGGKHGNWAAKEAFKEVEKALNARVNKIITNNKFYIETSYNKEGEGKLHEMIKEYNEANGNFYRFVNGDKFGMWTRKHSAPVSFKNSDIAFKEDITRDKQKSNSKKDDIEPPFNLRLSNKTLKNSFKESNRIFKENDIKDRAYYYGTEDADKAYDMIKKLSYINPKDKMYVEVFHVQGEDTPFYRLMPVKKVPRLIANYFKEGLVKNEDILKHIAENKEGVATPLESSLAKEFLKYKDIVDTFAEIKPFFDKDRLIDPEYKSEAEEALDMDGYYESKRVFLHYGSDYKTFLHEIGHLYTVDKLEKDADFKKGMEKLQKYYEEKLKTEDHEYKWPNVREFVADFLSDSEMHIKLNLVEGKEIMGKSFDAILDGLAGKFDEYKISKKELDMAKNIIKEAKSDKVISFEDYNILTFERMFGGFNKLDPVQKFNVSQGYKPTETGKAVKEQQQFNPYYTEMDRVKESIDKYC